MYKRRRRLGEAPEADFVTGGNNLLIYMTWALVLILVFYTIGNLPKILQTIADGKKKKKEEEENDKPDTPIKPQQGGASVTPSDPINPTPQGIAEVTQSDNTRTLQWLLKTAGYYTANVDGQWGSGSNSAMRRFEDDNNISKRFITSNYANPIAEAIPVVRQILKSKRILRGFYLR